MHITRSNCETDAVERLKQTRRQGLDMGGGQPKSIWGRELCQATHTLEKKDAMICC